MNFVMNQLAPLSPTTPMQTTAGATGLGTGLPVSGYGVAVLAISGSFVATITFQGVGPDGNTYTLNAKQNGATGTAPSGAVASTATTPGVYEVNCRGMTTVYANITAWTSGAVTVVGQAQALPASDQLVALAGSNAINEQAYNGTTWEPIYNNTTGTLLVSAARTISTSSPNQTNRNSKGVIVTLNITVASGTGGLQVQVYGYGASGEALGYMSPEPSSPITTTGRFMFIVYPGTTSGSLAGAGNMIWGINAPLTRTWYAHVTNSDASSYTYALDYDLIN